MYNAKSLYRATDSKLVFKVFFQFPWPLLDREAIMHVTGVVDYTNKALLTLSKSKEIGDKYFTYEVPDEDPAYPRESVKHCMNYFQYLGPNKTRYISINSADPKIDFIPIWFMNWLASTILYTYMVAM